MPGGPLWTGLGWIGRRVAAPQPARDYLPSTRRLPLWLPCEARASCVFRLLGNGGGVRRLPRFLPAYTPPTGGVVNRTYPAPFRKPRLPRGRASVDTRAPRELAFFVFGAWESLGYLYRYFGGSWFVCPLFCFGFAWIRSTKEFDSLNLVCRLGKGRRKIHMLTRT